MVLLSDYYLGKTEVRANPAAVPTTSNSPGLSIAAWLESMESANRTAAGENITDVSALQMLDVFTSVRVIAEAVGTLPAGVMEMNGSGRKAPAPDHDFDYMLGTEPNPEMSAQTFWETMAACKALTGNAYALIARNERSKRPVALYPLHPHRTRPVRDRTGTLVYETTDGGEKTWFAATDVLHFRLFSLDGLLGLSPIKHARQSLGIGMAVEKFGGRFFANGGRPTGVLSSELVLNPQQLEDNRLNWQAANGGENQGKTAVLSGGWKYMAVGMSPEEAQFLRTREFSRTQIAALFRLPPHMIGDTTRLSNANHEQESLTFVTDCLRPYLTSMEQEVARKLFPQIGRSSGRYSMTFDLRDRLRADFKTTHEALALGRQWGWYTANHCLTELGENPVGPQGDVLLYPINMGNAKALLDPAALKPAGASKPASPAAEPPPLQDKRTAAPELILPPSVEERAALAQYTSAFIRIFADATGRITTRSTRDAAAVGAAFEPALRSILEQVQAQATARLSAPEGWQVPSGDKVITDHLRTLVQRAQSWSAESVNHNAGLELNKAIRAITLNTYRDAGAAVALQEVEHA